VFIDKVQFFDIASHKKSSLSLSFRKILQNIIGFFIVARRLPAVVLHPMLGKQKDAALFIPWVDCTLDQQVVVNRFVKGDSFIAGSVKLRCKSMKMSIAEQN
jgi:hypothetical protein